MRYIFLLAVFLASCATPSFATTYYVATTGNDSNNGTSELTPKRTVAACVSLLFAGDTCYVRGGTYVIGLVTIGRSGTSSNPIKLLNYPGERPILDCVTTSASDYKAIDIKNNNGSGLAIGWITVSGFEIKNCYEAFHGYNVHDSVISNNWIHDSPHSGILFGGGARNRFERNIVSHVGHVCTTAHPCPHGMYLNGIDYVITNNLIYDNRDFGIQQNGAATYDPAKFPSPEFALSQRWIVANNTFAYGSRSAAHVVWGNDNDGTRIENNIFFENAQEGTSSGVAQGVEFLGAGSSTGILIRNNHFYATVPGSTISIDSNGPADVVKTGNVFNVSAPAFVNSTLASLDLRLTSSSPVNIARTNEFPNNSTATVGAFKTVGTPTASIHGNTVTLTFPISTAVPIQVPSSTGVSINCTGANCPGSPTVGSASRKTGTDSQVEVVLNGLAGDACVATDQTWTISYNSATGSWTGYDNIGPYPGLNQKIFSFTDLAVENLCDGTGSSTPPGGLYIHYKFDDGTGTSANDETANNLDGTLANGAGWTTGKTGTGINITGGTQQVQVPYGSGVNPSTQSMTWALAINVPSGGANATRFDFGGLIGSSQRAYVGAYSGTWRVASQGTSVTASASSNLTVDEGWNHLCVNWDSSVDRVTLYKNGVAGTGGATRAYTSFTLASDILLGITGTGFPADMIPGVYDDFYLYTSVEDCPSIYAAWATPPVAAVGTFGMPSYQFQAVYLPELEGSPTNLTASINQEKKVVAGGAVAVLLEVYCENVADCEQDAFKFEERHTASLPFTGSEPWLQVPGLETDSHIFMWGADSNPLLNSGTTVSRLSAGSCTVTDGFTVLSSAQVPVVDLPQDGCVVYRYIVRLGTTASGYYDLRLSQQSGTSLTGTVNPARINVVPPQANAGP